MTDSTDDAGLDVLAICAHPDDAELNCAGLLLKASQQGARIGVLDLSLGEAASRGTPAIRQQETAAASLVLGLSQRENLNLPDSQLRVNTESLQLIVSKLRHYRPRMVISSHWEDHHPDHQATGTLVKQACYLAGIGNYDADGKAHRPEQVLFYLDRLAHTPHLVQDVSDVFEQKRAAVSCYASQLYDGSDGHTTTLSTAHYLEQWQGRHQYFGSLIGVKYGEAYLLRSPVPLNRPLDLLWGRQGIV